MDLWAFLWPIYSDYEIYLCLFPLNLSQCSHDAVLKLCQLELRVQDLPFSNYARKKCVIFVCMRSLSVTFFTVLEMRRHRVNNAALIWHCLSWHALGSVLFIFHAEFLVLSFISGSQMSSLLLLFAKVNGEASET